MSEIERLRRHRMTGPQIARQLAMPQSTLGLVLRRLRLGRLGSLDPKRSGAFEVLLLAQVGLTEADACGR